MSTTRRRLGHWGGQWEGQRGAAWMLALCCAAWLPETVGVCPVDQWTAVQAVTYRFAQPVAEECAPCPRWSDTRGAVGVLNKSQCFCEHTTFNSAQQGAMQCRSAGAIVSTTVERMDTYTRKRARSPAREVWWVRTDEPVHWKTLRKEHGAISVGDVIARVDSGAWGAHLPLLMWWHGIVDELELWNPEAAKDVRAADSQWIPIQRLMPMLEAWAEDPTVCAVCDPAECIECCSRSSPARNCTDQRGHAVPRAAWWRRNSTSNVLHRCPGGPKACLGGDNTSCAAGYSGILCATCAAGYEEQAPAKTCVACPGTEFSAVVALLRTVVLLGFTMVLVWCLLRATPRAQQPLVAPELDRPEHDPDAAVDHPELFQLIVDADAWSPGRARATVISLRTLLSFAQMQGLILMLDLPWPAIVRTAMTFVASTCSPTVIMAPFQCLLLGAVEAVTDTTAPAAATEAMKMTAELPWPLQRTLFTYGWSVVWVVMPLTFSAMFTCLRWCAADPRKWALRRQELDRAVAVIVVTQYSGQPFLLTDGLRLLRCSSLEEEDDLFVLSSEPALPCELGTRLAASGMTVIIGLALPSLLVFAAVKAWRGGRIGMDVPSEARLERRRKGLRSEWRRVRGVDATDREVELHLNDAQSLRRYGFFVEGYRPGMAQGWEFSVLLRKLLMVFILVGLEPAGVPQLQGLLGLWVCFFALLCQWRWRPFARAQDNTLEELGLVANAMVLLSGLLWSAVTDHTTTSGVGDSSGEVATNDGGPAAAYEAATSGSGSGIAQLAAWLCVLVSHSLLGVHLLGTWCVASFRYCRVRCSLWCKKRAMRREIRRMTIEERNEAEIARREAQFIKSGDVSSIPKAKPDPMLARHEALAANNRSLQQAAVSMRKMVQGLEVMEEDWQKVGIGRIAIREQLAALGRAVEPVRAAIQALADRSAELQAAVHAEGIQRNMGKAKHGIKRLALLGQAGLLVGDEESTNKYRIGDGKDMKMYELPDLDETQALRPETHVPQVIPSAERMRADYGVGKAADDVDGISLSKETLTQLNTNQQNRTLGLPRPFVSTGSPPDSSKTALTGQGMSPSAPFKERHSGAYSGAAPLADLTSDTSGSGIGSKLSV